MSTKSLNGYCACGVPSVANLCIQWVTVYTLRDTVGEWLGTETVESYAYRCTDHEIFEDDLQAHFDQHGPEAAVCEFSVTVMR